MSAAETTNPEFRFTQTHFRQIASTVEKITGNNFPDSKQTLVYSRLVRRLRALNLQNFDDYIKLVNSANGQNELHQMAEALTTNVTKFFREDHHFTHLKNKILASLVARAKEGGRVRIWSAGCSSGQEPYSIALQILQALPDARAHNVRILATDFNTKVLSIAKRGCYPLEELSGIPADMRNAWTEKHSEHFEIDDAAKNMIEYRPLNLMESWPMKGPFDAIFCRNVMIYFTQDIQAKLWSRMVALLPTNAVLYIGHSERISGDATKLLALDGITTYRKVERASA
ncbi:CheR family methyltransferase [Aestuariivirga litoralis]|uniref:CheR family methyltransferase n=1 Tax=Aestuariivirga litoralis TaxID=2650924 RepID=UPI0018C67878|nr:protein-glutamate O-methyltransferase [Aestuariivirga litoralis]MBG1233215.1 protein-glutamate O-methyltransferase [Aestuariivirga litoralis]